MRGIYSAHAYAYDFFSSLEAVCFWYFKHLNLSAKKGLFFMAHIRYSDGLDQAWGSGEPFLVDRKGSFIDNLLKCEHDLIQLLSLGVTEAYSKAHASKSSYVR